MPAIPLSRSAFDREDLPPKLLKNYYFEAAPTNLEDNVSLRPRPRLERFAVAGVGPIRGLYREGGVLAGVGRSGAIICLSGTSLYRITQAGQPGVGTAIYIGEVEGPGRMIAEGSVDKVVFTAGSQPYTTDGATLAEIAFPDDLLVSAVDTLDQRFIFASERGAFYWTPPGLYTVAGDAFATAESQPDVLITLKVVDDVLWLVGRLSLEAWRPTGDNDLPFERIEGRVFGIGCTARDTCQKMNIDGLDTMCWVGTDRKVYRLDPNPVRISDFALEEALGRATPENSYAHHAIWNGHDFFVLHMDGEGTMAYDLTTRAGWAEWTSYGYDQFRTASSTIGPNAQALVGDDTLPVVYQLTEAADTDDGDPVIFEVSGILEITGTPVKCFNAGLTVTMGTASSTTEDPMMQCAISDDHGKTFVWLPDQPLGRQGNWTLRVLWTRLGTLLRERGRIFRWRTTKPVVIQKAWFNAGYR